MASVETYEGEARLFGDIFLYDIQTNKSKCILMKKKGVCNSKIGGKRIFNLKRHLSNVHKDYKAKIIENDFELNVSETNILNILVELMTINGRPFTMFNDSGFQKLYHLFIQLIERSFNGLNFNINIPKIKNQMQDISIKMRKQIVAETKNLIPSIMVDIATTNNRSILGINMQYVLNKKIIVRTLKMARLTESHTGEYVARIIEETLNEFEIPVRRIYSLNTDNGRNMLRSARLLDGLASMEEEEIIHGELTVDQIDEEFFHQLLKDAEQIFFDKFDIADFVVSLRCGAHTFQLAMNDAISMSPRTAFLIEKGRNVVKKLRTPNIIKKIMEKKLNLPILDNETRWNGKFSMVSFAFTQKKNNY